MKTDYLMMMENSEVMLEEVGAQALAAAAYQQPEAVLQAVDAVTLDNVVKVTRRRHHQLFIFIREEKRGI